MEEYKYPKFNLYHLIIRNDVDAVDKLDISKDYSLRFNNFCVQDAMKYVTFEMAEKIIEKKFNFTEYTSGNYAQDTPMVFIENNKIRELIIEKGNVDFSYELYRNSSVFERILEGYPIKLLDKIIEKTPKLLNSENQKSVLLSICNEDFEKFKFLIEKYKYNPFYQTKCEESVYDVVKREAKEFDGEEELQKCYKYLKKLKI